MESPVVLDKPPEYHGDRGFPFEEEEGSGAWSELAARHPDIAARLRQRPATWARKRRPSSNDATDDFGDNFSGFDRFPFDDIPPEFREHFPSHWNRRFSSRDEQPQQQTPASPTQPQQQTTATQTEQTPTHSEHEQQTQIPQYGLRNTVDLGQKSPADPSLVDADDRTHRSMSAPPDTPNQTKMSGHNHQEQTHQPHGETQSNVRHIPIFVEGRDKPVINKSVDHGTHFGEAKPQYVPPPPPPHVDRDQYFADDVNFHPPPNFSRSFGTPFNKTYRQGPQPFVQQKAYPQTAFARGASPQRSQSPKPTDEHFVKVPVHHETPKAEPPSRAQKSPQQHQPPPPKSPQQHQPPPPKSPQQQPPPQREQTPPQPKTQQPSSNDPITQILSIQTDVLNLMTDVENFTGTKKDKRYLFLDEMLTRNLIKLDNIETDGKENIRQARKEAIKCIQKCIAVLEAKADSSNQQRKAQPEQETQVQDECQSHDVDMKENTQNDQTTEIPAQPIVENGEVEMDEATKDKPAEPQTAAAVPPQTDNTEEANVEKQAAESAVAVEKDEKQEVVKVEAQEKSEEVKPEDANASGTVNPAETQPSAADTRPEDNKSTGGDAEKKEDKKSTPKKVTKTVKKRDKSKDKKDAPKDSNKEDKIEANSVLNPEPMSVDEKGDKTDSQVMDVDGAASQ